MNRKKGIVLAVCLCISGILYSMQNGALNVTGAPNEGNCTGCHLQTVVNSDPLGQLTISVPGSSGVYVPGNTYEVVVRLSYPGRPRFGFSLAARSEGVLFVPVGTFSGSPTLGLQITDYVTHTLASIQGNGSREWRFDWTAPTTAVGKITLYVAGVAANGDAEASGDRVYTQSVDLFPAATSVAKEPLQLESRVYPNPVSDKLFVRMANESGSELQLELRSMNGTLVRQEVKAVTAGLAVEVNLASLAPAVYMLHLRQGGKTATHRLLVYGSN